MRELQRPARSVRSSPLTSSWDEVVEHATARRSTTPCAPLGDRPPVFPLADGDRLLTILHHHWTKIGAPSTEMLRAEKRPPRGSRRQPSGPHPFPHFRGIGEPNLQRLPAAAEVQPLDDREFGGGEAAGSGTGVPLRAPDTMLGRRPLRQDRTIAFVAGWSSPGTAWHARPLSSERDTRVTPALYFSRPRGSKSKIGLLCISCSTVCRPLLKKLTGKYCVNISRLHHTPREVLSKTEQLSPRSRDRRRRWPHIRTGKRAMAPKAPRPQ
jgi:hypothetical protein